MTLSRLPLPAVLAVLAVAAFAHAGDDGAAPEVRDEAQLFSPDARQKADEELAALKDIYHLDFLIETFAAPPEDVRKQLQAAKNNVQKEQILRAWGEQRALDAGAEGVHILIGKDVGRTWYGRVYGSVVVTAPSVVRGKFNEADARALHDYLRWFTLGQNKPRNDAILRAALARVREDLAYNGRAPFPWLQVSGTLVGVLGLWGVLGLVRHRLHAGLPGAGSWEAGRLALFGGLLGGMFGTAAGHWIYDTLFVVASRWTAAEEPAPPATRTDPPPAMAEEGETDGGGEAVLTKAERLDLAARDQWLTPS